MYIKMSREMKKILSPLPVRVKESDAICSAKKKSLFNKRPDKVVADNEGQTDKILEAW